MKYYIPDKELLRDLRRTARKLGLRSVTRRLYQKTGSYSKTTICLRFGSWNMALQLAGLAVTKHSFITLAELAQNLKHVWLKLGREPMYGEMHPPVSAYSADTYASRYGSWRRALEVFSRQSCGRFKLKRSGLPVIPRTAGRKRKTPKKVSLAVRYLILMRDNFRCVLCGASPAITRGVVLHIDHIKPVSSGGETIPSNLQTLCRDCNLGKGAKQ